MVGEDHGGGDAGDAPLEADDEEVVEGGIKKIQNSRNGEIARPLGGGGGRRWRIASEDNPIGAPSPLVDGGADQGDEPSSLPLRHGLRPLPRPPGANWRRPLDRIHQHHWLLHSLQAGLRPGAPLLPGLRLQELGPHLTLPTHHPPPPRRPPHLPHGSTSRPSSSPSARTPLSLPPPPPTASSPSLISSPTPSSSPSASSSAPRASPAPWPPALPPLSSSMSPSTSSSSSSFAGVAIAAAC